MEYLLGIDLGTSSVKSVLIDITGKIQAIGQEEYQFDIPQEGWADQDPEVWWNSTVETIKTVLTLSKVAPENIKALGFSGQMHGLVTLDGEHKPIRKAIIWCDQRSKKQVKYIIDTVGLQRLGQIAHSPIGTGFLAASLLWMKENEPLNFASIKTVMLPKDYVRYKLTGDISTDITDAAGTLAFDCNTVKWSDEILGKLGFDRNIFPEVFNCHSVAGNVTEIAALITGLSVQTAVVRGGADQVMQAIGNGVLNSGDVSVTIGTGGQVLSPLSVSIYDSKLRSHTFSFFSSDSWYYMGASLSSGLSLKWFKNMLDKNITYSDIDKEVEKIPVGSDGLIFLPYLAGERTPYMNPDARGVFFGLTLHHSKYHLLRAIMEGVVFSLRDSLKILTNHLQQPCNKIIASGGGAKSAVWLQMQADIFNQDIYTSTMVEQAGIGAAITAGVGIGVFSNYKEACNLIVKLSNTVYSPKNEQVAKYNDIYAIYNELYQSTEHLMKRCSHISTTTKEG